MRPPTDSFSPGSLLPNGSWTGTTGQLQRGVDFFMVLIDFSKILDTCVKFLFKEVDLCVTTAAPTSSKENILESAYPLVFVDAAIVIPFPSEKSKLWLDTSTFTGSVYYYQI